MTIRQWIDLWDGRGIDEDGAFGAQCWDLAAKYAREMVGCPRLPTRPGGNGGARDVFEIFMPPLNHYFDRIKNDPNNPNQVPQAGDLVFYGNDFPGSGGYGHVVLAIDPKPGQPTFNSFRQNEPGGAKANIGKNNYKYCLGWLAPKVRPEFDTPAPPAAAQPKQSLPANEFYSIQKNDTFWDLENRWGMPHGTLQSLNAATKPRDLRIGQAIRVRPAATRKPVPVQADNNLYTIQRNDTFWDLEDLWNMPHGTLQQLNPAINPRTLSVGQVIKRGQVNSPPPAPAVVPPVVQPPAPAAPVVVPAEPTPAPPPAAPVVQPPAPVVVPPVVQESAEKPNWFQVHFSRDKIIKDLSVLGNFIGAAALFALDHYSLIAFLLSTLGGIILGENRFKLPRKL